MRVRQYEESGRGMRPARITAAQLRAAKAWGFQIVYDDIDQVVELRPPFSGFGPARAFAY